MRRSVFLVGLVTLSMLLSLTAVADRSGPSDPGGTFTDDDDSAHEGAIEAIAAIGVTKGCNPPGNYLFCPRDEVSRGAMAAFLTRAFSLPAASKDYFVDDTGSTFEDDINRLADAGITRGCNPPANDRYCPDDPVTRGAMAAFLNRAFNYPATNIDYFSDDDGSTFEDDINRLAESGVTKGCNPPANTNYCPGDGILREQMATFLMRSMKLGLLTPPPPLRYPVDSITGSDTFKINVGDNLIREPVRLIGIDAPEVGEACHQEATDALKTLIEGETVRGDIDQSGKGYDGHILFYVFLLDGTFVNAEMVRQGWATAVEQPPDTAFAFLFTALEEEARAHDRGIWGTDCTGV